VKFSRITVLVDRGETQDAKLHNSSTDKAIQLEHFLASCSVFRSLRTMLNRDPNATRGDRYPTLRRRTNFGIATARTKVVAIWPCRTSRVTVSGARELRRRFRRDASRLRYQSCRTPRLGIERRSERSGCDAICNRDDSRGFGAEPIRFETRRWKLFRSIGQASKVKLHIVDLFVVSRRFSWFDFSLLEYQTLMRAWGSSMPFMVTDIHSLTSPTSVIPLTVTTAAPWVVEYQVSLQR
jgi:hypothetical protein